MQDLTGQKFGRWTVQGYKGKNKHRQHEFFTKCECGNDSVCDYIALTRGKSTQCRSCARKQSTTGSNNSRHRHGFSSPDHPEFHLYSTWMSMKQRCSNTNCKEYPQYGGRGIKVCDEWRMSFETFLSDMGSRPRGHSIDRIDNNSDYNKFNCRWATTEVQMNNCQRTVYHELFGEKLSETQWARKLGVDRNKLMHWSRKMGIAWVVNNLDILNACTRNMSNVSYDELGLERPHKDGRATKSISYKKDLHPGDRFSKWTVLHKLDKSKHQRIMYSVMCDCGTITEKSGNYLRQRRSEGCAACKHNPNTILMHKKPDNVDHVRLKLNGLLNDPE